MAEARDKGRESTPFTKIVGGPIQQQQQSERHHNQQQHGAPPTVEHSNKGLQRMKLKKVVLLLTSIFDQTLIKPRSRYDLQVETNNTSFRILKPEKASPSQRKRTKGLEQFKRREQSARKSSK